MYIIVLLLFHIYIYIIFHYYYYYFCFVFFFIFISKKGLLSAKKKSIENLFNHSNIIRLTPVNTPSKLSTTSSSASKCNSSRTTTTTATTNLINKSRVGSILNLNSSSTTNLNNQPSISLNNLSRLHHHHSNNLLINCSQHNNNHINSSSNCSSSGSSRYSKRNLIDLSDAQLIVERDNSTGKHLISKIVLNDDNDDGDELL